MPRFRHPIVLAPPDTSASTAGVPVSGSTPGPVFDDRHSPIYATRGYYALGSFRVYPTWLGGEKAYAVGVEGAKGLFPGTGEAF